MTRVVEFAFVPAASVITYVTEVFPGGKVMFAPTGYEVPLITTLIEQAGTPQKSYTSGGMLYAAPEGPVALSVCAGGAVICGGLCRGK